MSHCIHDVISIVYMTCHSHHLGQLELPGPTGSALLSLSSTRLGCWQGRRFPGCSCRGGQPRSVRSACMGALSTVAPRHLTARRDM